MLIAVFIGLIAVPISLIIIWFTSPIFKDIMVNIVERAEAAGFEGFALTLANAMPYIVLLICFAAIIVGTIGLAKERRGV